jgi:O-methyltransferase
MLDGYQTNLEQAMNIYHLLSQVLLAVIPGDVIEMGSYKGITAILIQKTLEQFQSDKQLHLFDSFQGLPPKTAEDGHTYFTSGDCKSTIDELKANFIKHSARLPIIHAGWFKDTADAQPGQVAFAHLDGDFYSSILESLQIIYPRLAPGAVVVIDDYCDPQLLDVNNILPGVKRACDEFFADKPEKVSVLIAGNESHGYFRKI